MRYISDKNQSESGQNSQTDFRVRLAESSDGRHFCSLYNRLYARKVNTAYFSWQFFQPPFPSFLHIGETEKGEMAGCYGCHVLPLGTGQSLVAWALDIMIAPEYQQRGLFRLLLDPVKQEAVTQRRVVAICVMANERGRDVHVLGDKWHLVNALRTYTIPTSFAIGDKGNQALSIHRIDSFTDQHTEAWDRFQNLHPNLYAVRREANYLNWRFVQNPWYRYDLFQISKGTHLFGYIVLKVFKDPKTGEVFGDIVDLLWTEDDSGALGDMLRFALSHFHAQGVSKVTIWLQTNTALDEIGHDLGFVETEQKRYFCCKILDERYAWLKESNQWFITLSDSEIY